MYKVGDRVVITGGTDDHKFKLGEVCDLDMDIGGGWFMLINDKRQNMHTVHTSNFRPADRVPTEQIKKELTSCKDLSELSRVHDLHFDHICNTPDLLSHYSARRMQLAQRWTGNQNPPTISEGWEGENFGQGAI